LPKLWFFPPGVALLGHVCSSPESTVGNPRWSTT
jgi:hypothetical protein